MNKRTRLATCAALAMLTLTGCGTDTPTNATGSGSSAGHEAEHRTQSGADAPAGFGHVHGLGINPADGRLYVASHLGVFKQTSDGFERVADRYQDTMAFTVTGPDRFLASGHPDLREDKPPHLGLIESTDAAVSWSSMSLEGEADFHALEPAGDLLYGYDSNNGVLRVTSGKKTWRDIIRGTFVDLAADPSASARDGDETGAGLLATDGRGLLSRLGADGVLTPVRGAPRLAFVDWPERDLIVGVAPDGSVHRSRDAGSSWQKLSSLDAPPEALDVTPTVWHAATENDLLRSTDSGRSWQQVSTH